MVSFFRKKKKSAEATKDGSNVKEPPSPPPTSKQKDAAAASRSSSSSSPSVGPAMTSRSNRSNNNKDLVSSMTTPDNKNSSSSNSSNSNNVQKAASFPRRNFLAGSLRGSRSSVSRLPAVQEEIKTNPIQKNNNNSHPDDEGDSSTEGGAAYSASLSKKGDYNVATTPSTTTSTPDLLGSLSFEASKSSIGGGTPGRGRYGNGYDEDDDEGDAGVEILTPDAKAEITRQLFATPPPRESRVTSMEVSPEGLVSQLSWQAMEEEDDLVPTPERRPPHAAAAASPAIPRDSNGAEDRDRGNKPQQQQEQQEQRSSSSGLPRPKSSPVFVRLKDLPNRQTENQPKLGYDTAVTASETISPMSTLQTNSSLEYYANNTETAVATARESAHAENANAANHQNDSNNNAGATTANQQRAAPPESPFVPTRTISLERDRDNLVSPLSMPVHRTENEQRPDHDHSMRLPPRVVEDDDDDDDEDDDVIIEEDEGTFEETATLTEDRDGTVESGYSKSEYHRTNDPGSMMGRRIDQVAQTLMDSFQCSPDQVEKISKNPIRGAMAMFYDGVCKQEDLDENPRRPYFDEEFSRRFAKRMLTVGMSLLYLQPPHTTSNPTDDWKGRTVVIKIVSGSTGDQEAIQPKLQWTTMPGGTVTKAFQTSLPLMKIHAVLTATQNLLPEESTTADLNEDDLCFISITSASGRVYVFEANSVRERDEIANGLRNVIARLSFHLVAGDHQASTELYNDDRVVEEAQEPGDLPALANPRLNMNRMTHLLLDA